MLNNMGHSSCTTSYMHTQDYDFTLPGVSRETKLHITHYSVGLEQCYITSEITRCIFSIIPYVKFELHHHFVDGSTLDPRATEVQKTPTCFV
jgi:hypothetical protein